MLTFEENLIIEYEKSKKRIMDIIIADIVALETATDAKIVTLTNHIKMKTGSLADIYKILTKLNVNNYRFAKQVIPHIYTKSQQEVLKLLDISDKLLEFTTVDEKAVLELQQRLYENLAIANKSVGLKIISQYEEEMVGYATRQLTSGGKTKELTREFLDDLQKKDIFTISDKNGKKLNSVAYAKMNIKTTYSSAINIASINQTVELDNDLVRMSQHHSSCEVCGLYQGRVYSVSGNSTKYRALSEINDGAIITWGIVHPNCRHRFTPYVPTLDDNAEEQQKNSNKAFSDNRSEASIKSYNKRQEINRWNNEVNKNKESIKILETLPKIQRSQKQQEQLKKLKKRRSILKKSIIDKNKKWEMDKGS